MKAEIEKAFWKGIAWNATHLKKAAAHLGFWDKKEGDGRNTGQDELTTRPKYFERGRIAIRDFLRNDPDAFIDVVGSRASKNQWRQLKAEKQDAATLVAGEQAIILPGEQATTAVVAAPESMTSPAS